ncbi:hypothetical protein D915_002624 [Fasciola hepatica]|uniref:Uncharacterized protein n=1 Tax=Fasciola hepatica TaxID=6192 RepID=A0A2H1CML1_FASHE|nr:hypothetical protein D915_002624 [Fasciola hepatica]
MALLSMAFIGVLLLVITPTEAKAVVPKGDRCAKLVLETLTKCFLEPLNKKSCKKKNKLKELKKNISKLREKDLTTLVDMCNHCSGCKKDGKACVTGRMALGANNCAHLLKIFGKFGKK